jgi:hypothetical protein
MISITYSNTNMNAGLQHLTSNITTTATVTTNNLTINGLTTIQQTQEVFSNVAVSSNAVTLNFNNGAIFYCNANAATGNYTVNITNMPATAGYSSSMTLIVPKSPSAYYPYQATINGSSNITFQWLGGTAPTFINSGTTAVVTLTIFVLGTGSYLILAAVGTYQ